MTSLSSTLIFSKSQEREGVGRAYSSSLHFIEEKTGVQSLDRPRSLRRSALWERQAVVALWLPGWNHTVWSPQGGASGHSLSSWPPWGNPGEGAAEQQQRLFHPMSLPEAVTVLTNKHLTMPQSKPHSLVSWTYPQQGLCVLKLTSWEYSRSYTQWAYNRSQKALFVAQIT